ncbi:hypothetical protein [Nocardioides sp.]|uniref:hypothetical protein n=1 Tax=Nocardioides sp. TaxID=35761 RepID=UPI0039E35E2F
MALLALLFASCDGRSHSRQDSGEAVTPESLRSAVAVVYGNTPWLEANLRGEVAIVQPDGSFSTIETTGMYAGTPRVDGDAVYFSDQAADYRMDSEGIEKRERSGPPNQIDQWGGGVSGRHLTVFNSGTRNSARYGWDVSVWDTKALLSTTLFREMWDSVACGSDAYFLMGPWHRRSKVGAARLLRLTVAEHRIVVTKIGVIRSGRGGTRYRGLDCVDGSQGPRLSLLRAIGRSWSVGQFEVGAGDPTWIDVVGSNGPEIDRYQTIGTGDGYVMVDWEKSQVWRIDVDTGAFVKLFDLAYGGTAGYSLAGPQTLLVLAGASDDLALTWYDLTSGAVTRHVPIGDLAEFFDGRGEVIEGAPLSLR